MGVIQRSMLAVLLAAGVCAGAVAGSCPAHYVDGRLPEIQNPRMQAGTAELCYDEFGVMHSGITRTPLWSAEHLTAEQLQSAKTLSRENSFHAETRLPPSARAELSDYARSGYDRGHMAPNGDMPDRPSQHQSFTLANMVPQDGENNRHLWAGIEAVVRKQALKEGELYVLTGPVFLGANLQKIGNVLVPSHLYKVVYSPRQRAGAVFFVENRATSDYELMSIAQLEARIGINLLPSLGAAQKETVLRLPNVKLRKSRGGK
ncbi:DNA/RNA non-specific endonuclease [Pseudoduganella danionis]|uniref:DNA/RNA non-specific endonuclease n=1 Tax=Pseudoduganella danionis TaxID=1890295 RepID=UPI0035B41D87